MGYRVSHFQLVCVCRLSLMMIIIIMIVLNASVVVVVGAITFAKLALTQVRSSTVYDFGENGLKASSPPLAARLQDEVLKLSSHAALAPWSSQRGLFLCPCCCLCCNVFDNLLLTIAILRHCDMALLQQQLKLCISISLCFTRMCFQIFPVN